MPPDDRLSHLMFLWSLTPLVAAGCPSDDDGDDGTPGTASIGSGPSGTDASTDAGGGTTSNGADGSATSGADASASMTSANTSAADSTSGNGETGDGETGEIDCSKARPKTKSPISPLCYTYLEQYATCYGYRFPPECIAFYASYCQALLDGYAAISPECGAAAEEFLVCFNALSCDELMARQYCTAEDEAVDQACGRK